MHANLFAKLVFRLDGYLRWRQGVFEYSTDPECIFRVELIRLGRRIELIDGTVFTAGDPIAQIHLWNEHVPTFPPDGPTLRWAGGMSRAFRRSLLDMAGFLGRSPELRRVRAVRAVLALGPAEDGPQLLRIFRHLGFATARDSGRPSLLGRLHMFGENILVAMLILARNPRAFRLNCFRRGRTDVFIPREMLDRLYRAAGGDA